MMRISEVAGLLGTECQGGDPLFARVVIDSRQVQPGDLYVALHGEHHDGHAFVAAARDAGAVAALVDHWVDDALPQVKALDTLLGLQSLAAAWRSRLSLPVVAVTGSNGKTTTKQLLASVFAARGPVLATQGNLNNHIGVPLTLLSLRAEHRTAVVEMGANHFGEIARLCELAKPDVGIVTLAGDAHLEGFGSRDGVARAKGELFQALDADHVAVINQDDVYAPLWAQMAARAARIGFGLSDRADVRAQDIELTAESSRFTLCTPHGNAPVQLPMPGRHNIMNALAAAACGIALSVDVEDIAAGLSRAQGAKGRLQWQPTPQGARVLDDTYNANPTSLRAALDLLGGLAGRRVLVLGAMGELGIDAEQLHREAGEYARGVGIDALYATGALARHAVQGFGRQGHFFDDVESLCAALAPTLDADTTVLVKGSRTSRMERVVGALTQQPHGSTH